MIKGVDVYSKKYDYEDLKIAICVFERIEQFKQNWDYEDIARMTIQVKKAWKLRNKLKQLTQDEYAYIQIFAHRFLDELIEFDKNI